jgi:type VII secretion-associated serine protease mycosin
MAVAVAPVVPAAAAIPVSTVDVALAEACGPQVPQPLVEPPWALTRLRPDLAWPLSRGEGVVVAVIDSGVSADHPALAGKVLPGLDLVDGGEGRCDENGHGTLIAGIIAAREEVSAGFRYYGVAPEATILPVRVLRDQRPTTDPNLSDRIASAINWVVDQGAAIVNLSLTTAPTASLRAAVERAVASGVVVVAASGNQADAGRDGEVAYPAAYEGVIAVAGVDPSDAHVSSSVAGPYVDVAAPGVRISGPSPAGGGYLFADEGGTSFATGYVTGVAALVRAHEPRLTPAQVAERVERTADHPPGDWNPQVGAGVVNPVRAVSALDPGAGPPGAAGGGLAAPESPSTERDFASAAAPWVVVAGAIAALLVLLAVPVIRRGRARGWRSNRL